MTNSVHIKSLTCNDGVTVELGKADILVFTGANNCGKSQVLRDVLLNFTNHDAPNKIVIVGMKTTVTGNSSDLKALFTYKNGRYSLENVNIGQLNHVDHYFGDGKDLGLLTSLFVNHLFTENRLLDSKTAASFNKLKENPQNASQIIYANDTKEKQVSTLFHQAFDSYITVNRGAGNIIPIHVGKKLNSTAEADRVSETYLHELEKLPILETQGDGMRSFASIILNILTSNHTVTLIDEPEAFLHPPQARLLGKMLVKNKPNDRQLIISTHSEDFLKGLLDADCSNVKIIRINRVENINHINVLDNAQIKEFWKDPLLRYSNILSGLFHKKVVVCESDTDCRFYQAIMNALYDDSESISPDILFTHCGGKDRIKTVVKALKALNVNVVAVADIDILNDKKTFQDITESFSINWSTIESDWNIIDDYTKSKRPELNTADIRKEIDSVLSTIMDQNLPRKAAEKIKEIVKKSSAWTTIKQTGKTFFISDSAVSFRKVLVSCEQKGLFIVPEGEIESFYREIPGHGNMWLNEVLSKDLKGDVELRAARNFINTIINV